MVFLLAYEFAKCSRIDKHILMFKVVTGLPAASCQNIGLDIELV